MLPEDAAGMRAAEQWYRERERHHVMRAESARKLADSYGRQADAMEAGTGPLTIGRDSDTLNTMNASAISKVRRSKTALRDNHRRHPFVAMLVEKGLTIATVAAAIGRPRSTVQSWYKGPRDPGYREIPWDAAEKIRELYGLGHEAWRSVGPRE